MSKIVTLEKTGYYFNRRWIHELLLTIWDKEKGHFEKYKRMGRYTFRARALDKYITGGTFIHSNSNKIVKVYSEEGVKKIIQLANCRKWSLLRDYVEGKISKEKLFERLFFKDLLGRKSKR